MQRHTYAMIAAAGACIAAGISHTTGQAFSRIHYIWLVAIALWGVSFFSGLRHFFHTRSVLHANADLIKVLSGEHELSGRDPARMQIGVEALNGIIERKQKTVAGYIFLQFWGLVAGGLSYVTFHVTLMIQNASAGVDVVE